MKKIKVLVVDDEKDVRNMLAERLFESGYWEIIGQTDSVPNTISFIKNNYVEAIFLDIKIKQGNAFDVLDYCKTNGLEIPPTIINTGFAEFEFAQRILNDFGDSIIRLLKKPFYENWEMKELQIIDKINQKMIEDEKVELNDQKLIIKQDNISIFLDLTDIVFIEVEEKRSIKSKVCTLNETYIINKSLVRLKEALPNTIFKQINRQTLINKSYLSRYDHEDKSLFLKGISVRSFPVGRKYEGDLFI